MNTNFLSVFDKESQIIPISKYRNTKSYSFKLLSPWILEETVKIIKPRLKFIKKYYGIFPDQESNLKTEKKLMWKEDVTEELTLNKS